MADPSSFEAIAPSRIPVFSAVFSAGPGRLTLLRRKAEHKGMIFGRSV